MQPRRRLPLRLRLLPLLACLACNSVARGETLVIAADIWCPINCAPDSERPGIFVAGAAVQWLRDGIKLISDARDTELLAE